MTHVFFLAINQVKEFRVKMNPKVSFRACRGIFSPLAGPGGVWHSPDLRQVQRLDWGKISFGALSNGPAGAPWAPSRRFRPFGHKLQVKEKQGKSNTKLNLAKNRAII
jgi:hypothetical protein